MRYSTRSAPPEESADVKIANYCNVQCLYTILYWDPVTEFRPLAFIFIRPRLVGVAGQGEGEAGCQLQYTRLVIYTVYSSSAPPPNEKKKLKEKCTHGDEVLSGNAGD